MAADRTLSLLEWNWLPALYAHPAHWGALVPLRGAAHRGQRAALRLSQALLQQHGLGSRGARDVPAWLLLADSAFDTLARRLGQVLLAEPVRQALDRRSVQHGARLLGADAREVAYDDVQRWPALAAARDAHEALPADAAALAALGGGVMAALLDDAASGLRERLLLRFAPGSVQVAAATPAAQAEARTFLATGGRP